MRTFLDGLYEQSAKRGFIDRWMSLLNAARTEALRDDAGGPIEKQQQALGHASVRHSIENSQTFPFIKERLGDGRLLALEPSSGRF